MFSDNFAKYKLDLPSST